ncbi:hypothetical protein [Winogradskyella sp.]
MILFWSGLAIYFAIEFPNAWFDENYSRTGLAIVGIPCLLLVIGGLYIFIIHRITLTNDYIEDRTLIAKRIYFNKISNVVLGPNFIEIHTGKKKKILVSMNHEKYDDIKWLILDKVESQDITSVSTRKRYRKSW